MVARKISGTRSVEEVFRGERVGALCRAEPATAQADTPLSEVLRRMRGDSGGCVVIVRAESGGGLRSLQKPVGILTERDYLDKIAGKPPLPTATAAAYMSPKPKTLEAHESLDTAIQLMTKGGYRHLPLVDASGGLMGVLSARDIIFFLAELFPVEVMNLPPRLHPTCVVAREGE